MAISEKVRLMLEASQAAKTNEMEGVEGGVPRISLKKSRFTLKADGAEDKRGEELDVVILNISPAHGFVHTYYEAGYKPGVAEAPDCQSINGTFPVAGVANPQNDRCTTCPMQVWGSAKSMSGGKAKACKDSKHLYVKLADELDDPDAKIYLLNVTIMSLKAFGTYGKQLAVDDVLSPTLVITRLAFDDSQSVPVLTFESLGVMNDDNCMLAIEQSTAKTKELQLMLSQDKPAGRPAAKTIDAPVTIVVEDGNEQQAADDAIRSW